MLPPNSTVYNAVAEQIRGIGGDAPAAVVQEEGPAASAAQDDSPATASAPAIRVQVRVAAALQDRVAATDTVYVFARAAEGSKMPLAIQRFAASELPREVVLDDSSGMMPTLKLSQTPRIVLGARCDLGEIVACAALLVRENEIALLGFYAPQDAPAAKRTIELLAAMSQIAPE